MIATLIIAASIGQCANGQCAAPGFGYGYAYPAPAVRSYVVTPGVTVTHAAPVYAAPRAYYAAPAPAYPVYRRGFFGRRYAAPRAFYGGTCVGGTCAR